MPRRSLVFAALLLLAIPCLAQRRPPSGGGGQGQVPQQPPVVERKTELRVRLVTENDRPLQVVFLVQLCTSFGVPIAQNASNDRGEVTFYNLDPGNYSIVVSDSSVEPPHNPFTFEIYPGEGMHMEMVRVKLRENADAQNKFVKPPTARVSAAELNIPRNASKEFEKGNELWKKDKLEEARAHFEKAVKIYPQYAAAYNNIGVSWMQSNDRAKARDAFEHAVAADPDNGNAAMNLARLLFPEKEWPRLEGLLKQAVLATPDDAQALAMLAITEFNLKNYPEAVDLARRTHALTHDKFAIVHFVAARALMEQRKPDDAMVEYKVFLKEAPQSDLAATAKQQLEQLQTR